MIITGLTRPAAKQPGVFFGPDLLANAATSMAIPSETESDETHEVAPPTEADVLPVDVSSDCITDPIADHGSIIVPDASLVTSPLPDPPVCRRLDKPVAVVTGAARRVGREIALAMAARGLAVVVHHGTSTVEANVLVSRIQSQGGTAVAVSADLRDPRTAAAKVFEAAAELGEVTTLINSAAVFQDRALPWVDLYHCNVHLSVNLLAPIFLAQQFIRQLGEGQRGHIVNILDWRAQRPGSSHLVYTATKAALTSVTKSLALQLAPLVQVNGIAPGAILPPEDRRNWHEQRAISSIPLRRTGTPQELVDAINFLLDANFITGEILNVSGGEEL